LPAIEPALRKLESHHAAFQRPEGQAAIRGASLRAHRRGRTEAALKLNVLLAEMGETQLVDELRRLSFDGRIRRLERFAEVLKDRGRAQLPG
jgi:hypothetical protein